MFGLVPAPRARTLFTTACVVASALASAGAQDHPTSPEPRLRLSRERQIELAVSTAPPEISRQATIHVLEPKGYVVARAGTNGFHCLVEHQLLDTYEPTCYDPEGSATLLHARLFREELRAQGLDETQVAARIDQAFKSGRLKAPRKPGFAYMMAKDQRVFDPFTRKIIDGGPPHLMFYAPHATNKDFGGFLGFHAPFVLFEGQPDAIIIVLTAGPPTAHQHQ